MKSQSNPSSTKTPKQIPPTTPGLAGTTAPAEPTQRGKTAWPSNDESAGNEPQQQGPGQPASTPHESEQEHPSKPQRSRSPARK